jgi:hypothetical protein
MFNRQARRLIHWLMQAFASKTQNNLGAATLERKTANYMYNQRVNLIRSLVDDGWEPGGE